MAADGQVTIEWEPVYGNVSGDVTYNIYWNNTGDVSTSDAKITGVTSPYVHAGYTNDTMHYYTVSAVNAAGESPVSSEAVAITMLMANVVFADANLQACVDAEAVTWSFEITELVCVSQNISDISGIENLTNLSASLVLSFNNIIDISQLSILTNLGSLVLGGNSISDISSIESLVNLTNLALFDNLISDISPLVSLPNISTLMIGDNNISDLSQFTKFKWLSYLGLYNSGLSDVRVLASVNAGSFGLGKNNITDLTQFSSFTQVNYLDLTALVDVLGAVVIQPASCL